MMSLVQVSRPLRLSTALSVALVLVFFGGFGTVHAVHKADESEGSDGAAQPDALKPKIIIPEYVSPLKSFKPHDDVGNPRWKEANDTVGEIGGWRAYAMEAYEQELAEEKDKEDANGTGEKSQ